MAKGQTERPDRDPVLNPDPPFPEPVPLVFVAPEGPVGVPVKDPPPVPLPPLPRPEFEPEVPLKPGTLTNDPFTHETAGTIDNAWAMQLSGGVSVK